MSKSNKNNKFDADKIIKHTDKRASFYVTNAKMFYYVDEVHPGNGAMPMPGVNLNQLFSEVSPHPLTKAQLERLTWKLMAKVKKSAIKQEVYTRIGFGDGAIYLDLGKLGIKKITAKKVSMVDAAECPVLFYKPDALGDLPMPVLPEFSDVPLIRELLKKLLNLEPSDIKLVLAWLLAPFCKSGTKPVLLVLGQQGSTKTYTSKTLIRIVDGNEPLTLGLPTIAKELFISANGRVAVAYDNTSEMRQQISDGMCRIASGAAHGSKKLYHDDAQHVIWAHAAILINGITAVATKGDLLDRSLRIQLPTLEPSEYKLEEDLEAEFQKNHPRILGGIVRLVQAAMKNPRKLPPELKRSRLVDFSEWTFRWAEAAKYSPDNLMLAIGDNQNKTKVESLGEDPALLTLIALLDASGGDEWTGLSTEFYEKFMDNATNLNMKFAERLATPQSLTARLTRAAPALAAAGIEYSTRHSRKGTVISVKRRSTK